MKDLILNMIIYFLYHEMCGLEIFKHLFLANYS